MNNQELTKKMAMLKEINAELQGKVESFDNVTKSHNTDLRSVINQKNAMTKKMREIEKESSILKSEVKTKDDRLAALRQMNNQLETKIGRVLKRMEDIKVYENRENELVSSNQQMMSLIEELGANYDLAVHENNDLVARINSEFNLK